MEITYASTDDVKVLISTSTNALCMIYVLTDACLFPANCGDIEG